MRKFRSILIAALSLLSFVSCHDKGYEEAFLLDYNVCLRRNSVVVFYYDPLTCQLACNASRNEYRAFTDNMSDYFNMTLSSAPREEGETVRGSLEWTTSNNIQYLTDLDFKVEKMDSEGRIWLWNKDQKLFVVIRQL